jgi:cold shock CspA family protein
MSIRGMITNINYTRGCGFIQPEADPNGRPVRFEQDVVVGRPFADLLFGEMVTYELAEEPPPPAELLATRVVPEGL